MNATVAQAIVSGASGVVGAFVGAGLQIRQAASERNDRRSAERDAVQRGIAGQTLENVGRLVNATTSLRALQETIDKARAAGHVEAFKHAVEQTESVDAEHSANLYRQIGLGFQITDEEARNAAVRIAEDISELMASSHTPIEEDDASREARVKRVTELDDLIGAQYRDLCRLLGPISRT